MAQQQGGGGGGGSSVARGAILGARVGSSSGSRSSKPRKVRSVSRGAVNGAGAGASRGSSSRSSSGRSSGGGGGGSVSSGRSSRSSSGYAGGGSVGSTSGGSISYAKPPKPPTLAAFLGTDSTYIQQKSALEKAKADYLAQQGKSRTNYETGYATDLDTLGKNRTSALADLENDYASRGLMNSGLYADSLSSANNDWDKRGSALEQAKAQFLEGLSSDFGNFSQEQLLTLQRAEQEAAARRASQYGV